METFQRTMCGESKAEKRHAIIPTILTRLSLPLSIQFRNIVMTPELSETVCKKLKPVKDRSGVEPYRSRLIGWMLKICSVLVLIGLWLGGLMLFAPIALVLLYIGNQIASVPPKLVRESDKRSPILYLRSFLDDRITNLTPDTTYAIGLGVLPPQFFCRSLGDICFIFTPCVSFEFCSVRASTHRKSNWHCSSARWGRLWRSADHVIGLPRLARHACTSPTKSGKSSYLNT